MKLNDVEIKKVNEVPEKSYIIANSVDGENLKKTIIDVSSIPSKEYVQSLEEQNNKLINIIQTIIKNIGVLETKINDLSKAKVEAPKETKDATIDEKLNIIISKLHENILEL